MGTDPTLPPRAAGPPAQFPPPTDPWSAPTPPPRPAPLAGPAPAYPVGSPPVSGPPFGPPPGPVVAQIAEIAVTSSTVHTPAGDIPLTGSTWQVSDYWQSEQKTPRWAVVLAVVGFCVLAVFSLLFLLVKQTIHRGTVQVTVTNGPRQYVARIPVGTQAQVQHIHQQVNYVRSLAAL